MLKSHQTRQVVGGFIQQQEGSAQGIDDIVMGSCYADLEFMEGRLSPTFSCRLLSCEDRNNCKIQPGFAIIGFLSLFTSNKR